MADAQILAVGITVLAVLAGTLFSNSGITDLHSRLGEMNVGLNRHIDDTRAVLRAEMRAHFTSVDAKLAMLLKMLQTR